MAGSSLQASKIYNDVDCKLFDEAEMGYLAGIASAHANQAWFFGNPSENKGMLSALVVTDQPVLVTKRYMNGFKNGVLSACPACNILRLICYGNDTSLNDFQGKSGCVFVEELLLELPLMISIFYKLSSIQKKYPSTLSILLEVTMDLRSF